jgi:hypothetical protein
MPTDDLKPIYTSGQAPFGYDVCGRHVLHRQGRPGMPEHLGEMEATLFKRAMTMYRHRTGTRLNVGVWSFAPIDTSPLEKEIAELRRRQREVLGAMS